MSATLAPLRASVGASPPPVPAAASATRARRSPGDRSVLGVLGVCFIALTALTWRKWGVPEIDAGAELSTADLIKHGAVAYKDVRYYYGPLGLYSLALSFKLFGSSFTTAFAFGLIQTAAIVAAFYALARQWLVPLVAGLASAVLLAIGFSGTAFNFILPHTDSATFGILCLLLMLLALTRERVSLAGLAAGLVALTRPEFVAVAAGAGIAYVVGMWRVSGPAAAWRAAWRMALPAIALPAVVYAVFSAQAGASRLFTENLWPVKFLSSGAKTEESWMPFTLASLFGLIARGALYCGLLAGVVASAVGWSTSRERGEGPAKRVSSLWPVAAALVTIALLDGVLRAGGIFSAQRSAIELESRHLVLGMSWLPALGLAAAAWALVRLIRKEDSLLGRSWPADLALIVAAAGLGLRAYNAFTTEGSYAPYYAAPLVLLLGILHERVAARWPQARAAVLAVLGLIAAGLAAYALGGLYVHDTTTVHTPRGSFVTTAAAAPALQAAVRQIDAQTKPGQPILAAPTDGGLYFMSDRKPALYELTVLPGLIATPGEERAAVAHMRGEGTALAVLGARDLSIWGKPTFGVSYNPLIGAYIKGATASRETVGTLANPVGGTNPSHGFTIVRLR